MPLAQGYLLGRPMHEMRRCTPALPEVHPETSVQSVAKRAMARTRADRFLPIACSDEQGGYLGLVRVEHLVDRLASR